MSSSNAYAKMKSIFALAIFSLLVCRVTYANDPTTTVKPPEISIQFLSAEAGGLVLADDQLDDFISGLHPREAAAMMGIPRGDKTRAQSRQSAKKFFREAAMDFDADERAGISSAVQAVTEAFGDRYPLLVHRPWKFVKSRRDLCGGFSFTRQDCIVFSEMVVNRIVETMASENDNKQSRDRVESLLLHEQMHVLQRATPKLFLPLYESLFGFRKAQVKVHSWINERQVSNPDGLSVNWVAMVREGDLSAPYWIGTLLLGDKDPHRMGYDFSTVAVRLKQQDDGGYIMPPGKNQEQPDYIMLDELKSFTDRLPIRGGYDHPNEVAAYLLTAITHGELPPNVSQDALAVQKAATQWFLEHLKSQSKESK